MTINIQKQHFFLHPTGAIFWLDKNILLISDVHLGKVAHFRKYGLAIPNEAIFENFVRLNEVFEKFNPKTVIFLGDLFHSKINKEWELFSTWIKSCTQKIILIEGNHDIIARHHYEDLQIDVFSELIIDNFIFTHHPTEKETFFNFCGHIHPGIKLKGLGRQYLKLSCFFQKPQQMILPAFGEFTGNFYLIPTEKDLVYAITETEVIFVKK